MRKFLTSAFVSIVSLTMLPAAPIIAAEESFAEPEFTEVAVEDQAVVSPTDMMHFIMDVRWGNVEGEVTNREESNFDGSVSVPAGGHVSLRRLLLFEGHDSVTGKVDPVSWTSKIYGHWDGVRVVVSARASDTVTIATTQGTFAKTAQELFEAGEPIVQDVGEGREIIVRARPFEKRGYFLMLGWGKVRHENECENNLCPLSLLDVIPPVLNFSGSAEIEGGGKMRVVKRVRFEDNDSVVSHSETRVEWRSVIRGGVDGLLLRIHPDRFVDASDTLTVAFPEMGFSESFGVLELFHDRLTKRAILIDGQDQGYGVVLRVWEHPYRKLLRARGDDRVWVIENGLRRHVVSADAFNRSGLRWEDVEVLAEEDTDIYPEGDPFGYEDGILIKGSGPPVWVLSDGKRRHLASPSVFEKFGYRWENIIEIPDSDVAQYPESDTVDENDEAPEGSLIRVEGLPSVYLIRGGKRLPIPSIAVFSGNKFGWENVMEVKLEIRDRHPQGEAVGYPDGSLLRSEDGKVYVLEDGERQWVRSAEDFTSRGFEWNEIQPVSDTEIAAYDEGTALEFADL